MKLPALLLTGSLAANAALLALFAFQPALAPPVFRDFFLSDAQRAADLTADNQAARARSISAAQAAAAKRTGVWANLEAGTTDLKSLIARLRAAGFSPVLIRAIVNARLEATFADRMKELLGAVDTPFWKSDPFNSYFNNSKFYETQSQIYRDRAKALREILGDAALADSSGEATAAERRKFGDLPKAKLDLVQRVADDYAEMISQIKAATNGIILPEDREKLALLERERRADLAALLTPAELEDYEMRNSPVTSGLRTSLTLLDATDAEFRTIYRTLQPYAAILYPDGPMTFTSEMSAQRSDAQKKVAAELRAALGEPRYADYTRASDRDYQSLSRLAQRDGITTDAVNRAYDLRVTTAEASMRIHDAKLPAAERTAALAALVTETKNRLTGQLGTTVADTYAKTSRWLTQIERGYAIRLGPDGSISSMMGPSTPPPATTPAPKK